MKPALYHFGFAFAIQKGESLFAALRIYMSAATGPQNFCSIATLAWIGLSWIQVQPHIQTMVPG